MRTLALFSIVLVAACGGVQLLPTTAFHALLDGSGAPVETDWARLLMHAPDATSRGATRITAQAIGERDWLVWGIDQGTRGTLVRALRTPLGLEAQASGTHVGPCVRPTLRALRMGLARILVVESSTDERSTERDAWLYAERGSRLVALALDDGTTRIGLRAERRTPIEGGWARVTTLTATIEALEDHLIVHEHASVREVVDGRPEVAARTAYEVERARVLRASGDALHPDRPSLFADTSATPAAAGR